MLEYILAIILLVCSYPLAMLLYKLTKDEKKIYDWYFPALLWIFVIGCAIFLTLDIKIALIFAFLFLVVLFWKRMGNSKNNKKYLKGGKK